MALTGRLGALALLTAVLVGLAAPSWAGVAAATGGLLALAALDVALAASPRGLALRRTGATATRLGVPAEVVLEVANPGPRHARGRVRDGWPPSAGVAADRFALDLPPGERRRLTVALRPTRRGDRTSDLVTLRLAGPLGLAARQASRAVPWTVRVLPPFGSRKHLPSRLARLRELDGRAAALVRGQGTEFDSLREYVVGDDVRSIDWRASARAADVMVRTWRPERDRHVLLVLDTGRTSAGRVGEGPRLDASMDAALLLAALAARAGDRVDLLAYDRRVRADVAGVSASGLLPALTQAMATVEPELTETDMRGLAAQVLRRAGQRSLVVLLSTLDPAPVREGLLPVLGLLTARHQVVLASVADPRVDALAAGRGTAEAVYDAASAERARGDRDAVREALTRRGVVVVDGDPEHLPPRLADSYLALKASGRL
jgi:uncharacterized protein (DUF58 family)